MVGFCGFLEGGGALMECPSSLCAMKPRNHQYQNAPMRRHAKYAFHYWSWVVCFWKPWTSSARSKMCEYRAACTRAHANQRVRASILGLQVHPITIACFIAHDNTSFAVLFRCAARLFLSARYHYHCYFTIAIFTLDSPLDDGVFDAGTLFVSIGASGLAYASS